MTKQITLEFIVIKIINGIKYLYKDQLKDLEATLKRYYPEIEDEKIKSAVERGVGVYFNIQNKEGVVKE